MKAMAHAKVQYDKFLKIRWKIEKREEAFKQVNEYRQKAERKH